MARPLLLLVALAVITCTVQSHPALTRGDDVISGSDFLSVFMGPPRTRFGDRTESRKPRILRQGAPTSIQDLSDTQATSFDLTSVESIDKSLLHDIPKDLLELAEALIEESSDLGDNDTSILSAVDFFDKELENETNTEESFSTTSEFPVTSVNVAIEEDQTALPSNEEPISLNNTDFLSSKDEMFVDANVNVTDDDNVTTTMKLEEDNTTEVVNITENSTTRSVQQVVSIRVSSTVAQAQAVPDKAIKKLVAKNADTSVRESNDLKPVENETVNETVDSNEPSAPESDDVTLTQDSATALLTEEDPQPTAVERVQFSVEEASPVSSEIHSHHQQGLDNRGFPTKVIARVVEVPSGQVPSPSSYQTSVTSATSQSRVQFYRRPLHYHQRPSSVAESIRTSVITNRPGHGGIHYPARKHYGQTDSSTNSRSKGENQQNSGNNAHHEHSTLYSSREKASDASVTLVQGEGRSQPEDPQFTAVSSIASSKPAIVQTVSESRSHKSVTRPNQNYQQPEKNYGIPEQNYEVDESVSVMTNGRAHGVQPTAESIAPVDPAVVRAHNAEDPNQTFGYVVEGRDYRKYHVEERTPEGFIVGEYGVVRRDDGNLRGVRYTADGTISPQLIHQALVKFLNL